MMIALLLLVFTSVSPQGLPAPSASSAPEAVAEIRGRIVDQETGAPLKQCVIHMGSPDGQRQYKTQSDADGFYRLANVTPGRYVGGIDGPPFQGIYLVQSFTETTGGFGITLKAGEVRQFNVALKRALTLTVRVRDEEGEPLSRIRVGLMSADGSHQVHASWTRMTDDRGLLRVLRIPPGRYRVCAEAEPLATTRDGGAPSQEQLLRTCYPSAVDERQAALVAVSERAAPELEIVMRRGRTLTVSGTVFDSTGLPSAQARVGLNFYVKNGSGSRGMVVGPDGRFRLTNIVPGEYAVVATLGGTYQPELRREYEAAFVPLHLDTADAEDLVLRMAKTLTVKGTVVPEEIGTPLPPSPGSGLGIFARHAEDRLPGSGELNVAHADKDGTFELTRLFGAQLLEVVNLPRGWYVKSVRYRGEDLTGAPVTFRRDRDGDGALEITLSTKGAILTGTVTADDGTPVPGARVIVFPTDSRLWNLRETTATTARPGTFRAGPLRAGSYYVAAVAPGSPMTQPGDREHLARLAEVADRVTLNAEEERLLTLQVVREK